MTQATQSSDNMRGKRWYKYLIIDILASGVHADVSSLADSDSPFCSDEFSNQSILQSTSEESISTEEEEPYALTMKDRLSAITNLNVRIPDQHKIIGYLAEHEDLFNSIYRMSERLKEEFPEAELSLEVYSDPEFEEEYPTIYVRQVQYESDIMERIESIQESFGPQLEDTSGQVLITSDFRSPKF